MIKVYGYGMNTVNSYQFKTHGTGIMLGGFVTDMAYLNS